VAQAAKVCGPTCVPYQTGSETSTYLIGFLLVEKIVSFFDIDLLITLCSTDTVLYPEPNEFYPRFCLSYLFKPHN